MTRTLADGLGPLGSAARQIVRGARRLRALARGPAPVILMYHRVADETFDPWGLAVSPGNFADQMRWLSANRTVIPIDEFANRHRDRTLPATAAAITFDDGYSCIASDAAPLLEELGIPATVFLPATLVERGGPFWWDELEEIVLRSHRVELTIEGESVSLGDKNPSDREWAPGAPPRTPRQEAFHRLWAKLRPLPPGRIDSAIAKLRVDSGVDGAPAAAKRPLTPREVRASASSLVQFGSHALTHPWLTSLDNDEKRREIIDSIGRCETLTGARPSSFAYPYGSFDEESVQIVSEAGYLCACSTKPSAVTGRSSLFALPRLAAKNRDSRFLARDLGSSR